MRGHLSSLFLKITGGGIFLLTLAGLYFQSRQNIDGLILIALLQGALYLAATFCIGKGEQTGRTLHFILLIAVLARLGPLLQPPALSTDIYRYIWDGRVGGAGINPYRYVPADRALASLRDAAIYPNINRADYARTIYPPAAQIVFVLVTRLSERVTAMKLAMLVFDAGTIVLLLLLLRLGSMPAERVLIYAWHPLTIWEIAGSGHVDVVLCFLLAVAFLFRRQGKAVPTGIALGVGTLIKFLPLLLVPALYRKWDWRLPVSFALTIVLLYLPYLAVGWHVLGFLPDYVAEERFAGGTGFFFLNLFDYLTGFADPPIAAYAVVMAAVLGGSALRMLLRPPPGEFGFAASSLMMLLVLFLLVTPHHPWYFLWLLPILCLIPYRPALLLTALSFILYATLGPAAPARDLVVNSLLYGPFAVAVLIQLCLHRGALQQARAR